MTLKKLMTKSKAMPLTMTKDTKDESGIKGDNGSFVSSLLMRLRHKLSPKATNPIASLVTVIHDLYVKETGFKESKIWVLPKGELLYDNSPLFLSGGVVSQLGVRLASQLRRYFIDSAAGILTSLPQSPVRYG